MTAFALRPALHDVRRRPLARRRAATIRTDTHLISVAGAVGSHVFDGSGRNVGTLDDLVVDWEPSDTHPALVGAVVRTRRKRSYVPVADIADLEPDRLLLKGPLRGLPPERQPWHVALAHDVLDRQIVDENGGDVARVSDLVLARFPDGIRLIGGDVSARTLLRRLGTASMRREVSPSRVYDWASVGAFPERGAGDASSVLRLTSRPEPAA
jgi:sporulation protein YlmC with PRC-barrel domain